MELASAYAYLLTSSRVQKSFGHVTWPSLPRSLMPRYEAVRRSVSVIREGGEKGGHGEG